MKKNVYVTVLLLLSCLLFFVFVLGVSAIEDVNVEKAEYVYLYNVDNKKALYKQKENDVIFPGSTVKIMTGLLAVEYYEDDFDRTITVSEKAVKGVLGHNVSLKAGENVTVRDMLYAMLIGGANDAARVLAFEIASSEEEFVKLMNKRAKELGAVNTVYTNCTGMHDPHMVTTAYDTFLISLEAYANADLMDITSTKRYEMPANNVSYGRRISNKNFFVSDNIEQKYYYSSARGLNAGSTYEAGYSLVTSATNEGLTYLCIVMGANSVSESGVTTVNSYTEAKKLLDWAFDNFGYVKLVDKSMMICEIPVSMSADVDHVTVVPANQLEVFIEKDIDPKKDVLLVHEVEKQLSAPIDAGEEVGVLTVSYKGEVLGEIKLVTNNAVEGSNFLIIWDKLLELTGSKVFVIITVVVILIFFVYVFTKSIVLYKKTGSKK